MIPSGRLDRAKTKLIILSATDLYAQDNNAELQQVIPVIKEAIKEGKRIILCSHALMVEKDVDKLK